MRRPDPLVILTATLAAVALVAAACSGSGQPGAGPTPSTRTGSPSSSSPAAGTDPLTGLPTATGSRRPALVVKIENSTAARPQAGLDRADLVVEELVEGGITRYAAMFHSTDPGTVGPVRSVRNVDADIASPTRGLLAFSGGAGVVLKIVDRAPVQLVSPAQVGGAYRRTSTRRAPHNLYASAAKLWAAADARHRTAPAPYLPFATDAGSASSASGTPAHLVRLTFSSAEHPRWTYDAASRTWLRSEGSTPAKAANGTRLAATTVLVLRVRLRDAGYRDPVGNPVPETVLTGSGALTAFSGGREVKGTWQKSNRDARFRFTGVDGKPLSIAPGRTWIELLPLTGSLQAL